MGTLVGSKWKYPYEHGKHLIVAVHLLAYADESGLHKDAKQLVIAGAIGSPRQWKMFELAWNSVLEKHGVKDFHSVDFFHRHDKVGSTMSPYRDWSDQRALDFLSELLFVMRSRRIFPIWSTVDIARFKQYPERTQRYLTGAKMKTVGKWKWKDNTGSTQPYYLAFLYFLMSAADSTDKDAKVHFVFDRQEIYEPYAVKFYNQILNTQNNPLWERLGTISYASRIENVGLQLADLNAFVAERLLNEKSPNHDDIRLAGAEILTNLKRRGKLSGLWDQKSVDILFEIIPPEHKKHLR